MKFIGGTSNVEFTVGRPFGPRKDQNGAQKTEKGSGRPLFVAQLIAIDRSGAETSNATVAGENSPGLAQCQSVHPDGLEAIHWVRDPRRSMNCAR